MMQDLKDLRSQRYKIESLEERIARLRSAMEMGTRRMREVPGGGNYAVDRLSNDIARLDELERELMDEVMQLEQDIRFAEYSIDTLPEPQQKILRLRYIDGLSWQRIAQRTNYSVDHCFTLHRMATKKLKANSQ